MSSESENISPVYKEIKRLLTEGSLSDDMIHKLELFFINSGITESDRTFLTNFINETIKYSSTNK